VPRVVARTEAYAATELRNAGFTVVITDTPSADYSSWTVAAQDPLGGTVVKKGSVVHLTLNSPKPTVAPATTAPTPTAPDTVMYSVWGNGTSSTSITYSSADGSFSQEQANGAAIPWSITLPVSGRYNIYSVLAQADDGDSISCAISRNGRIITQKTSTGQYAIVTCTSG
jgi:hypothetical protein